ncbi:MAG: cobalt-precorrin-5B (C(1))-methyltransferase CbiD [Thermodesulfobacteriota bacterium]
MEAKGNKLRRGFTTGTAASAAAVAAVAALLTGKRPRAVPVTLPGGGVLRVKICELKKSGKMARAVVIKDGGDDPDVTNRARIVVEVELTGGLKGKGKTRIIIKGGVGVGRVTRAGLAIPPGRPAINPVPLKMIRQNVREVIKEAGVAPSLTVTVSVPGGEKLARKTMNPRLGIVGGISILGTTGIVEPLSLDAYRHSIACALDVAVAAGLPEVVLSTGRSSEKAAERALKLPETACILTGDHMGFALEEAAKRKGIKKVTVAGQFGKFTKLASGYFQTHCSRSSVELGFLAGVADKRGVSKIMQRKILKANTAREVFFFLREKGLDTVIRDVCGLVGKNAGALAGGGIKVRAMLVGYDGKIVCKV